MKKKVFAFLIAILASSSSVFAKKQDELRKEKAVQISIASIGSNGNRGGYGASVNLFLNESLSIHYIGYTPQDIRDNTYEDEYGQSDLDSANSTQDYGAVQAYELRLFPFEAGFFFSFGSIQASQDTLHLEYLETTREVGDNFYFTDLIVDIEREDTGNFAYGLGFTYLSENDFSFTIGTLQSLNKASATVNVTTTSGVVSDSDLALLENEILEIEEQNTVLTYISVGFQF